MERVKVHNNGEGCSQESRTVSPRQDAHSIPGTQASEEFSLGLNEELNYRGFEC